MYDLALSDWISIGLNKDRLHSTIKAVRERKRIPDFGENSEVNSAYIQKIMREEIAKQFSERKRPALEVVLNAIDAKPAGQEDYSVRMNLGWNFSVADNGVGMCLEDILRFLIIPFNTDKNGIDQIGRFGVGFLSTFNYCTLHPKSAAVYTDTQKNGERFFVKFYASGPKAESMRMRIAPKCARNRDGTVVKIKTPELVLFGDAKDDMICYLERHLDTMPEFVSKLDINNRPLNYNRQKNAKWVSSTGKFNIRGKIIEQDVGLYMIRNGQITLTSQGVSVTTAHIPHEGLGATIYLPSGVQVVEGRDEFKYDANFAVGVKAAFESLEKVVVANQPLTKEYISELVGFIPTLAASMRIKKLEDIPNLERFKETLLKGKKYVLTSREGRLLQNFVGLKIDDSYFVTPESNCTYWAEHFDTWPKFLRNRLALYRDCNVSQFLGSGEGHITEEHVPALGKISVPNLVFTARNIQSQLGDGTGMLLFNFKDAGKNPLFVNDKTVYVNVAHPLVSGPFDRTKAYAVANYFMDEVMRSKSDPISFSEQIFRSYYDVRLGNSFWRYDPDLVTDGGGI